LIKLLYKSKKVVKIKEAIVQQELPFEVEPAPEPEPAVTMPEPEPEPVPEPEPEPERKPNMVDKLKDWLNSFMNSVTE
jgi:cell division protein FtsZ